ncbi:hypothetical protein [Microbulbifer rhizosphaerae]|uniref:Uncharacterized protein n=1 Tax=Microbulbifer rhizosphaerae TaxID=1562603 RepID=A0A7W4WEZ0_9GAMM|nr:hypothetical protein [Microbulbifer rhizosphaerae]MBB3062346.1 hypothetical protein [Microbulbifer rhizosphaerae]
MNLSTSSSERALFARIVLVILLGMGAALGLVRLFHTGTGITADAFLGRVLQAKAALPRITAEPQELVMFFGSSRVEAGFSPRQFDREMAARGLPVKSFNFGFGGLNPLFQDTLSRRIREQFERDERRLKIALIEFNPFQATVTRRNRAREAEETMQAILGTPQEFFPVLIRDPERGVRLFNIRYLRGGISAEAFTSFVAAGLAPPRPRTGIPEDEAAKARRRELNRILDQRFQEDYPDYRAKQWHYGWQGGGTIAEERSAETLALFDEFYATLRTEHKLDDDRLHRINTADIIELNFDPELVEAFIRIVKNFQAISDRVEVLMLPKNSRWIQNTPEATERLAAAVARIEEETGLRLRNDRELPAITPEMFVDTTHLARYTGGVAYTRHLVEELAPPEMEAAID